MQSTYTVERIINGLLSRGTDGIQYWNQLIGKSALKGGFTFIESDLSNLDLSKINVDGFKFIGAKLIRTNLSGGYLQQTEFKNACLVEANLEGCRCADIDATNADFSRANLKRLSAENGKFTGANFDGADLAGAILKAADIRGANFSNAEIGSTMFNDAKFDEKTKFPASFVPGPTLIWTGAGNDPRSPSGSQSSSTTESGITDFNSLVQQLWAGFEAERIQRSLGMLQSEKFHLFADVKNDYIAGVARSQTKEERVYACVLTSSGSYGCCTQNLRHCGALRGMACKHVFLLLFILTKTGAIDPQKAFDWLKASLDHKPTIDKTLMTEIFLRHKGAEEGEIDWRPIDTVPEDYYA